MHNQLIQLIIKDSFTGLCLTAFSENEFLTRVKCAENRRKAKHAGRFTFEELCKIFKMKCDVYSSHISVDTSVPITCMISTDMIDDIEIKTYRLLYALDFFD